MNTLLRRSLLAGGLASAPAAAFANGGDTFASATVIPNGLLNFSDTGTNVGAASNIDSVLANVNGLYTVVAGPDVFYRLNIAVGGTISITVTPSASWDPSIYLTNSALVTNNPGLGANSGRDSGGIGAAETLTFNLTPGTYYLAVDSFYGPNATNPALGSGTYSLAISGTAIVGVPEPGTVAMLAVGAVLGGGALWRPLRLGAR